MSWLVYAFMVVVGAAGIHIFSKLSAGLIDPVFAMLCASLSLFVTALCIQSVQGWSVLQDGLLTKGVFLSLAVGLCIALAHYAIFFMYRADAPLSVAMPIARMGAAVIAVAFGVLFLQEQLTLNRIIGFVLAMLAIVFITR